MKEVYLKGKDYDLTIWESGFSSPGNNEDSFMYRVEGTLSGQKVDKELVMSVPGIEGGEGFFDVPRITEELSSLVESIINRRNERK